MKRKLKKGTGLYAYLEACGVLEHGIHEEIQQARKKYWQEYKRNWKINKRKEEKYFQIFLNNGELKAIKMEAQKHKRSITAYIKQAALAYASQRFLVPDILATNSIKELLTMLYSNTQKLLDQNLMSYEENRVMMQALEKLEIQVLEVLFHPEKLEAAIRKELNNNSGFERILLSLLQQGKHDY